MCLRFDVCGSTRTGSIVTAGVVRVKIQSGVHRNARLQDAKAEEAIRTDGSACDGGARRGISELEVNASVCRREWWGGL